MEARKAATRVDTDLLATTFKELQNIDFNSFYDERYALKHIPITRGAFPQDSEHNLVGYIAYCNSQIGDSDVRKLALYASFCVLEDISYTRKDGQYLRWDYRSGRSQGKTPFNKGKILSFSEAIYTKLDQIAWDITTSTTPNGRPNTGQLTFDFEEDAEQTAIKHTPNSVPQTIEGSCLDILPTIPLESIDCYLTSPPYANRYDYTRTYALELVFLGCSHQDVTRLRQAMLSCTVENKAKRDHMYDVYAKLDRTADFERVERTFKNQAALQEVLSLLVGLRERNELNNPNIVSLVHNYFYEICFTIFEMVRTLAPGGHIIMVNDNVRYAGEEIPVDLILASFAEEFGLIVAKIWTLARGKGNSSQQMGAHGRAELRKCVYVWHKPN